MKLFIASDLHGCLPATETMLARYQNSEADWLILLGDLLNHGPRNNLPEGYNPIAVAECLNNFKDKIIAVRGNCDSEVDQALLSFPITASFQQVLLPNMRLFLTHGHIYSPDNLPPLSKNDGLIYGHTHIPKAEYVNDILYFNPGSTSIPREKGEVSYGLFTQEFCQVRSLSTDKMILTCDISA